MHTNHDGVRATAIVLRSVAASSSWRSPVIAVEQASEIASAALRVNNSELTLISFRCVELKATSVTSAEFYGSVIPSNLHVPVNSAVVYS